MSDLSSLTETLERNPRDAVTLAALADWIEERGGEPAEVRRLTVADGDCIIVGNPVRSGVADFTTGYPMEYIPGVYVALGGTLPDHERDRMDGGMWLAHMLKCWLKSRGLDVFVAAVPADMTIRHVKLNLKKEASE